MRKAAIPGEYLAEYCVDRVDTTATVWLGLTLSCCRCHDHKFDPFTQRDYYGLFAFFHNVPEVGVGSASNDPLPSAPPFIDLPLVEEVVNVAGSSNVKASQRRRVYRTALVMQEMVAPRATHILMRGAYDKPAAEVTAGVPGALSPLSPDLPRNRLGLARWLVDPINPLPARVTVNRLWQSVFGVGLVRTTEDFGTQGELPSHPELLDWLATELMRREWDMKAMLRLLVTSSTYRQSSRLTPVLHDRDPENRLLARGAGIGCKPSFCGTRPWRRAACWSRRSGADRCGRISRRVCTSKSHRPSSRRFTSWDPGPIFIDAASTRTGGGRCRIRRWCCSMRRLARRAP